MQSAEHDLQLRGQPEHFTPFPFHPTGGTASPGEHTPHVSLCNSGDSQVGLLNIHGIDFTSSPGKHKPIVSMACELRGDVLHVKETRAWTTLGGFEAFLEHDGPWLAGCDFPFGQARRFIENIGWPRDWSAYVAHAGAMSRAEFRAALDAYRAPRAAGDREHRRSTDKRASAISPQKLYGVPVGLMFHAGAPLLQRAEVHLPSLRETGDNRIVVEAYPGVMVRSLFGRVRYKSDSRAQQSNEQTSVRADIIQALSGRDVRGIYGVNVELSEAQCELIVADKSGDRLDALLCAVQAAWAWRQQGARFGCPVDVDPLEGWIADPSLCSRTR